MPPKSKRKRTRLDHLIPDGQECVSQQFYLTPAAALRGASASVIPPRPSSDALCNTIISDDRRRIYRTPIPLRPTGEVPLFDNILHPDLRKDDPATLASSAPADYFNAQDEDQDGVVQAVDDATRELEISVRALVTYPSQYSNTPCTNRTTSCEAGPHNATSTSMR